ncbi:MAG: ABC transporter permease subunit [Chloroflexi bacterium]|nr:ABC transporter permease subunit [Chloroflexota bacterium]MCL5275319.1 ABC transporter permease subunit [Chloroflexota bacterium]
MLELSRLKNRIAVAQAKSGGKRHGALAALEYARQNWTLFLLALPGLLLIFMFSYAPMFGVVIAFEDYSPRTMFASPFVGLRNFATLFDSSIVGRLIANTLLLNFMFIIATTFFSVLVAILLNEVRSTVFKRVSQSVMFLPFFMGWTIVAMVLFGLIDYDVGTINALITKIGLDRIILTDKPEIWPFVLTLIRVWKGTGSGCIIYLAVLISVDPQLHEAAAMDGAGRWGRIRYISLPALVPVIILLVLLDIGRIFYGDFGMIYAVIGNQANLYSTTDVIDTYILRALQSNSNYGFSAAVGLSQSIMGFICVFGANWLVKKYSERRGEDYRLF